MNADRILTAALVAPLSVFPVVVIPLIFLQHPSVGLIAGFFAVTFAYIGMLLIGVPIVCLLHRFHATRWWQVTLAGALSGPLIALFEGERIDSDLSAYASAFSALVAFVTWFVAYRRLPADDMSVTGTPE